MRKVIIYFSVWGAKKIKWPIYVWFFHSFPKGCRQFSAVRPTRQSGYSLRWEFTNICEHSFCLMKGKKSEIRLWMLHTLLSEVLPSPASILTYSIEQSPSWEANRFSASQKKSPLFIEPEGSLSHSQVHATCPCLEPDRSSPYLHIPLPEDQACHLRQGLPSVLFPSGFLTKTLCTPLLSPILAVCHAHLILLDLITRTILSMEYSFSVIFSILLLPRPS